MEVKCHLFPRVIFLKVALSLRSITKALELLSIHSSVMYLLASLHGVTELLVPALRAELAPTPAQLAVCSFLLGRHHRL